MHKKNSFKFLIIAMVLILPNKFPFAENQQDISLVQNETKTIIKLKYQNGLLDADIKSGTIRDIIEELKKQTGFTYEIEKEILEQKVTISFKDKELTQAIKEILNTIGNPSYMISYKNAGAIGQSPKYVVSGISIQKRGSTEVTQTAKRELQPGEMDVGLVDGKYRIRAKDADVNELLKRLSDLGDIKIMADEITGKVTIEAEEGIITATFLEEELMKKIRPKIYKFTRHVPERDRNGKKITPFIIEITRFSDIEMRQRREQAELKNAEGERLMKQGRYLEAEAVFGNVSDPDYINSVINLGKIYLLNRNYPNAIGHFNTALEIDSANAESLSGLIEAYEKTDQRDKALETFGKYALVEKNKQRLEETNRKIAYLKDPKTENYYLSLRKGDEYRSKGDISKAKEEYEKSIKERPDLTSAYKRLAEIYESAKELEKSAGMYKKVIEIDEKDFDVYFKLGSVYANTGKVKEAIETFEKLSKVYPDKSGVMKARVDQIVEGLKRGMK